MAQTPLIHNPLGTPTTDQQFQILPLQEFLSWNPEVPWGGNDGALWQGVGLSTSLTAGVRWTQGILSVTLEPEFDWSQNAPYDGLAPGTGDYWYDLDWVRRYSETPWSLLGPGQSEVRLNFNSLINVPLTIGFGTTNLWFGPARRTSILMSDNAAGFPHFDLGLLKPWDTAWGTFQGEIYWGQLSMTNGAKGLYQAVVVGYSPPSMKFLTFGAARAFISPMATITPYKTVESFIPAGFIGQGDADDADQQATLYFDANLAQYGFEVYGEYAVNDNSGSTRDLLLQPDHAAAYVWGVRQSWHWGSTAITLGYEEANLGLTIGSNIRPEGEWYRHPGIGSTNDGQLLGASIGPGSNSNTFDLTVQPPGPWSFGAEFERVAHDVDYTLVGLPNGPTYGTTDHAALDYLDVSAETLGWVAWTEKPWMIKWSFSYIKDLNHDWIPGNDLTTWRTSLAITYDFP